jgi:hypothetical protein
MGAAFGRIAFGKGHDEILCLPSHEKEPAANLIMT